MYSRIIRNDVVRNKAVTLTTAFFITAAAMLVSLAAILTVNLTGAIDALMTRAKTPHFMQMHSGDLDMARLRAFAEQNGNVEQFQVVEFVNVDGARIQIGRNTLVGNAQDNGFSTQSESFDYLLDLDGNVIHPSAGELYVPICYMKDNSSKIGDKAVILGKELTVAGFLRDSQMNSTLSSSKRFLVSTEDYADIQSLGSIEYLIEFRLKDLSGLGAFQTAYTSAGLEANGPAVTYPLFRMVNAISDGLMIAMILLISTLAVAVAFLCIRFTLLAKVEEDYREIGVMKAIGLRVSDIKKLYLSQYAAIAAAGCMAGAVLSVMLKGMLLENIRLYMGESENTFLAPLFGIIGILLVFLIIMAYVNGLLRRFKKISSAEAIRFGTSSDRVSGAGLIRLSGTRLLSANLYMGIKDVISRRGLYATMLAVLVISTFILIVPQNLYNTISSPNFITYMGVGRSDLRIDLQQIEHVSEKAEEISQAMKRDPDVSKHTVLATKTFQIETADGSLENLKVELGDHSVFPLTYSKGRAPAAEDEVALSILNARELGKMVGDELVLLNGREERKLTVSGIYSDITNGGKTAKAVFDAPSAEIMWAVISAELNDAALLQEKAAEYTKRFDYAKVSDIEDYVTQTFGSTRSSIGKASNAAIVVALVLTVLITLLFMNMLVAKDRSTIAVLKAVGFTDADMKKQFVTRSTFVLIVGVVLGTLLANTLGESLAGMAISSFGAASFQFEVNPISAYLVSPAMMAGAVLTATIIGISGMKRITIFGNIKE
jgi:putative ABC transport system permease protein